VILNVNGEVIGIRENDKGRIVKVLHSFNGGKEVAEVFYGKTDKEGKPKTIPDFKVGSAYKGQIFFKDFCFPVAG